MIMQKNFIESQSAISPEVWAEVVRAAVPVVGDLVGTLKAAVTAWGGSYAEGEQLAGSAAGNLPPSGEVAT